jgi:hypothetical protein
MLKMPNFKLKPEKSEFTTFPRQRGLQSSSLLFLQSKDQRQDIREGWWLVNKYNCMGCHQVRNRPEVCSSGLPRIRTPD